MKNTSRGFTLIELLVVISIMGVLASAILVSLKGVRAKGRDASRVQAVSSIVNALELHRSSIGAYPIDVSGMDLDDLVSLPNMTKYIQGLPSNFAITGGIAKYLSDESGSHYEIIYSLETSGYVKNLGCLDSEYEWINSGSSMGACRSTGGSLVLTPKPTLAGDTGGESGGMYLIIRIIPERVSIGEEPEKITLSIDAANSDYCQFSGDTPPKTFDSYIGDFITLIHRDNGGLDYGSLDMNVAGLDLPTEDGRETLTVTCYKNSGESTFQSTDIVWYTP